MISIMGDLRILVTATLADRGSVEALIHMLNMIKDVMPRRVDLPTEITPCIVVGVDT